VRVWVWRAFAQGEAYVSAEPERERVHGVDDSVPDEPIPSPPRLGISRLFSQSQSAGVSIFRLANKAITFIYALDSCPNGLILLDSIKGLPHTPEDT